MKTVTVDQIMFRKPCDKYTEERVRDLWAGREALTALDVLDLKIPPQDRLWAVLHEDFLESADLHELACRLAETALPVWEAWAADYAPQHLDVPRIAIDAKRAWMRGEMDDAALSAARCDQVVLIRGYLIGGAIVCKGVGLAPLAHSGEQGRKAADALANKITAAAQRQGGRP